MKTLYKILALCAGIIAYAQPSGSCTTGTTKFGTDKRLYGCVEGSWRRFSENVPKFALSESYEIGRTDIVDIFDEVGVVEPYGNSSYYDLMVNNSYSQQPISSITGHTHVVHKIVYANKHFYEGLNDGKWYRIDNDDILNLPTNWSVSPQFTRYLASVYDNNYFPLNTLDLSSQPTTANTTSSAPDDTNDDLLNYQGKIGAYTYSKNDNGGEILGIDDAFEKRLYAVNITFSPSVSEKISELVIPSTLAEAVIPAQYIKNSNQDVKVYLKAYFGNVELKISRKTTLTAYVVAERNIDLVQLDMNQGIGRDGRGVLLTTFNVGGSYMQLRLLPGMPDKYAGKRTNTYVAQGANKYEHDMFYMPVTAADGKTWLGNNLGANYAQLKNPDFNPLQQAKNPHDTEAYGSVFQWQRDADGHELQLPQQYGHYPLYPISEVMATHWRPGHSNFIAVPTPDPNDGNAILGTWHNNPDAPNNLWRGQNNPCPVGMAVPFSTDWREFHRAKTGEYAADKAVYSSAVFDDQQLKLPNTYDGRDTGGCLDTSLANSGSNISVYGSSTHRVLRGIGNVLSCSSAPAGAFFFGNRGSKMSVSPEPYGTRVRCIKK